MTHQPQDQSSAPPTPGDIHTTVAKAISDLPLALVTVAPHGGDLAVDEQGPEHLDVCDHLEDVLSEVGVIAGDVQPPLVFVRCTTLPKEQQRTILKRLLTWPTARGSAPDSGGNRVMVSFQNRPQLRVEFSCTAVGAQHFEASQVARWHIDKSLLPGYRAGSTHPVLP